MPQKATPPKAPAAKAGSGVANKRKSLKPSDQIQNDALEPIAWTVDIETRRTTVVSLDDLDDYQIATLVGCGLSDTQIIIASFRIKKYPERTKKHTSRISTLQELA